MQLLHIDTSITAGNSVSRTLSKAVADKLAAETPGTRVTYRDLAAEPIAHLSGAYLAGVNAEVPAQEPALQADIAAGQRALADFLAADTVVIGVGFYNFGIPSQLKAWIDRITVAGTTFRYGPNGPEGLAGGKRVVLAIARGGFYGPDQPTAGFEHAESYLRALFGFLGITDLAVVAAEGVAVSPAQRERAVAAAMGEVERMAA